MFFAGPCTGGSSWARLNRSKGPETEAIIEAKVEIFKQLWGRFAELFISYYDKRIGIYMELPRGCEYWNKVTLVAFESTLVAFASNILYTHPCHPPFLLSNSSESMAGRASLRLCFGSLMTHGL